MGPITTRRSALFFLLATTAVVGCEPSRFIAYDGPEVTRIVVHKSARRMYLLHHDEVLEGYDVRSLAYRPRRGHSHRRATGERTARTGRLISSNRRNSDSALLYCP